MSTDLKFSLVTTIIVLGLIVAGGLTAALHCFPPREFALPHPFRLPFPSIVCE